MFVAIAPIASGEELFYKYKNREVTMGWERYRMVGRPPNPYTVLDARRADLHHQGVVPAKEKNQQFQVLTK